MTNNYSFVIVVNKKVTKSFKGYASSDYVQLACGMMYVEHTYHKTAEMYIYQLNEQTNEYELIDSMDANMNTYMPAAFSKDVEPFTLNY